MELLQRIPEHALSINFAMAGKDPAFQDHVSISDLVMQQLIPHSGQVPYGTTWLIQSKKASRLLGLGVFKSHPFGVRIYVSNPLSFLPKAGEAATCFVGNFIDKALRPRAQGRVAHDDVPDKVFGLRFDTRFTINANRAQVVVVASSFYKIFWHRPR